MKSSHSGTSSGVMLTRLLTYPSDASLSRYLFAAFFCAIFLRRFLDVTAIAPYPQLQGWGFFNLELRVISRLDTMDNRKKPLCPRLCPALYTTIPLIFLKNIVVVYKMDTMDIILLYRCKYDDVYRGVYIVYIWGERTSCVHVSKSRNFMKTLTESGQTQL